MKIMEKLAIAGVYVFYIAMGLASVVFVGWLVLSGVSAVGEGVQGWIQDRRARNIVKQAGRTAMA